MKIIFFIVLGSFLSIQCLDEALLVNDQTKKQLEYAVLDGDNEFIKERIEDGTLEKFIANNAQEFTSLIIAAQSYKTLSEEGQKYPTRKGLAMPLLALAAPISLGIMSIFTYQGLACPDKEALSKCSVRDQWEGVIISGSLALASLRYFVGKSLQAHALYMPHIVYRLVGVRNDRKERNDLCLILENFARQHNIQFQ